jgi:hypothetical protein
VADTIKSYLHFSVPDVGPLVDYEDWMPDFMKGLARGIEQGKGLVAKAVDGVASEMVIQPKAAELEPAAAGGGPVSAFDSRSMDWSGLTGAIREAMSEFSSGGQGGDIVIPVYVGGTMLDEVIVNAQQRANLRSGGR